MLALRCNGSTGGPALWEEIDSERIREALVVAPVDYEPSKGWLAPPPEVSADDWTHPENGWGLAGCGKNRLTERFVGLQCEMLA